MPCLMRVCESLRSCCMTWVKLCLAVICSSRDTPGEDMRRHVYACHAAVLVDLCHLRGAAGARPYRNQDLQAAYCRVYTLYAE